MFYRFAQFIMWLPFRVFFRLKVVGRANIPGEGPFLVCANHTSYMDPIAVATVIRRRLFFMGKRELFKRRFFGFILRGLGAFPINRESTDMKAFKRAIEVLNGGDGLLLFAQGHRMKEFEQLKNGAALFALKTGSPIIPVGINSSFKPFSKVIINIGEPISMEEHKDKRIKSELLEAVMENVSGRIKELLL